MNVFIVSILNLKRPHLYLIANVSTWGPHSTIVSCCQSQVNLSPYFHIRKEELAYVACNMALTSLLGWWLFAPTEFFERLFSSQHGT